MIYRFGEGFELDLNRYELRSAGEPVHVEPQVFDVLAHLLENHDRVVSKEELLDEIWGDRFVSESALTSRLKGARRAVGDDGRRQALIRTVHGRGYQFHAEVSEESASGQDEMATPLPATSAPPNPGIPRPQGTILGRESELGGLFDIVAEERLTTVIGPGGTGKTRFVTEFALGWPLERSAIAFLELAQVVEPSAISDALAGALSIQIGQRTDLRDACVEYLSAVRHLLVIDNCEHLAEPVARLLDDLLRSCPELRVVTTSRIPLGLAHEALFRLDPLPVPSAGTSDIAESAVVSLFVRRARRVDQSFTLDDNTLEAVRSLCESLDGLPLAVELAAGRLATLDLDDLHRRLDRRLDLLGGTPESGEDRHRTLRATLAWSYNLLEVEDQKLLRHLSVFPGGVSLEAAEWLAGRLELTEDPAVALSRLVAASVVVRSASPATARYTQLETVRAFGLDRLDHHGERAQAEAYLVEWVENRSRQGPAGSSDEALWDDRIRRSLPNFRAARQLMIDSGDLAGAAGLSWNLDMWARFRGQSELWRWADELLERDDVPPGWSNRVTSMAAQAAWLRGRIDRGEELARRVLANDPTDEEKSHALSSIGTVRLFKGDYQGAVDAWSSNALDVQVGSMEIASASIAAAYLGNFEQARGLIARARAGAEASRGSGYMCWIDYCHGEIEATEGTGRHAPYLDSAIREARRLGIVFVLGVAMVTRASHRAREGQSVAAAENYIELIDIWLRSGSWAQMWTTLRNVAELLMGHDDETAIRLWAAADVDPHASVLTGEPLRRRDDHRAEAIDRLGLATVERLEAEARLVDRSTAVVEAKTALQRITAVTPAPDDAAASS